MGRGGPQPAFQARPGALPQDMDEVEELPNLENLWNMATSVLTRDGGDADEVQGEDKPSADDESDEEMERKVNKTEEEEEEEQTRGENNVGENDEESYNRNNSAKERQLALPCIDDGSSDFKAEQRADHVGSYNLLEKRRRAVTFGPESTIQYDVDGESIPSNDSSSESFERAQGNVENITAEPELLGMTHIEPINDSTTLDSIACDSDLNGTFELDLDGVDNAKERPWSGLRSRILKTNGINRLKEALIYGGIGQIGTSQLKRGGRQDDASSFSDHSNDAVVDSVPRGLHEKGQDEEGEELDLTTAPDLVSLIVGSKPSNVGGSGVDDEETLKMPDLSLVSEEEDGSVSSSSLQRLPSLTTLTESRIPMESDVIFGCYNSKSKTSTSTPTGTPIENCLKRGEPAKYKDVVGHGERSERKSQRNDSRCDMIEGGESRKETRGDKVEQAESEKAIYVKEQTGQNSSSYKKTACKPKPLRDRISAPVSVSTGAGAEAAEPRSKSAHPSIATEATLCCPGQNIDGKEEHSIHIDDVTEEILQRTGPGEVMLFEMTRFSPQQASYPEPILECCNQTDNYFLSRGTSNTPRSRATHSGICIRNYETAKKTPGCVSLGNVGYFQTGDVQTKPRFYLVESDVQDVEMVSESLQVSCSAEDTSEVNTNNIGVFPTRPERLGPQSTGGDGTVSSSTKQGHCTALLATSKTIGEEEVYNNIVDQEPHGVCVSSIDSSYVTSPKDVTVISHSAQTDALECTGYSNNIAKRSRSIDRQTASAMAPDGVKLISEKSKDEQDKTLESLDLKDKADHNWEHIHTLQNSPYRREATFTREAAINKVESDGGANLCKKKRHNLGFSSLSFNPEDLFSLTTFDNRSSIFSMPENQCEIIYSRYHPKAEDSWCSLFGVSMASKSEQIGACQCPTDTENVALSKGQHIYAGDARAQRNYGSFEKETTDVDGECLGLPQSVRLPEINHELKELNCLRKSLESCRSEEEKETKKLPEESLESQIRKDTFCLEEPKKQALESKASESDPASTAVICDNTRKPEDAEEDLPVARQIVQELPESTDKELVRLRDFVEPKGRTCGMNSGKAMMKTRLMERTPEACSEDTMPRKLDTTQLSDRYIRQTPVQRSTEQSTTPAKHSSPNRVPVVTPRFHISPPPELSAQQIITSLRVKPPLRSLQPLHSSFEKKADPLPIPSKTLNMAHCGLFPLGLSQEIEHASPPPQVSEFSSIEMGGEIGRIISPSLLSMPSSMCAAGAPEHVSPPPQVSELSSVVGQRDQTTSVSLLSISSSVSAAQEVSHVSPPLQISELSSIGGGVGGKGFPSTSILPECSLAGATAWVVPSPPAPSCDHSSSSQSGASDKVQSNERQFMFASEDLHQSSGSEGSPLQGAKDGSEIETANVNVDRKFIDLSLSGQSMDPQKQKRVRFLLTESQQSSFAKDHRKLRPTRKTKKNIRGLTTLKKCTPSCRSTDQRGVFGHRHAGNSTTHQSGQSQSPFTTRSWSRPWSKPSVPKSATNSFKDGSAGTSRQSRVTQKDTIRGRSSSRRSTFNPLCGHSGGFLRRFRGGSLGRAGVGPSCGLSGRSSFGFSRASFHGGSSGFVSTGVLFDKSKVTFRTCPRPNTNTGASCGSDRRSRDGFCAGSSERFNAGSLDRSVGRSHSNSLRGPLSGSCDRRANNVHGQSVNESDKEGSGHGMFGFKGRSRGKSIDGSKSSPNSSFIRGPSQGSDNIPTHKSNVRPKDSIRLLGTSRGESSRSTSAGRSGSSSSHHQSTGSNIRSTGGPRGPSLCRTGFGSVDQSQRRFDVTSQKNVTPSPCVRASARSVGGIGAKTKQGPPSVPSEGLYLPQKNTLNVLLKPANCPVLEKDSLALKVQVHRNDSPPPSRTQGRLETNGGNTEKKKKSFQQNITPVKRQFLRNTQAIFSRSP